MAKVKWGVLGAGGIARRRTIPGLIKARNAELVAVMDTAEGLAHEVKAEFGARRAYTTTRALLADPEVEAVYIASPVAFHKEQALACAASGKHILIEKPIALTAREGEEVAKACDDAGIIAAAGFMMRLHTYHRQLRELVAAGRLGRIVSCRAQLTCWYPEIPGAWRQYTATSGGGAMMDMGIHCIDLIQYITGAKAVRVSGMTDTLAFGYEVEDASTLLLRLDNGAIASVEAYFCIPDAAARGRLEIYGTRGSALCEGTIGQVEGGTADVFLGDDTLGYDARQDRVDVAPVKLSSDFGDMYTSQIEAFGRSILEGAPVAAPLADALQAQRIVEACYESAKTRTTIDL
ncbi:MAG: Gfo/Idh/MocA family protein [Christensenellales bacterium]|jgi:predicted dehydrogenase